MSQPSELPRNPLGILDRARQYLRATRGTERAEASKAFVILHAAETRLRNACVADIIEPNKYNVKCPCAICKATRWTEEFTLTPPEGRESEAASPPQEPAKPRRDGKMAAAGPDE